MTGLQPGGRPSATGFKSSNKSVTRNNLKAHLLSKSCRVQSTNGS
jgi:hypothetical protein